MSYQLGDRVVGVFPDQLGEFHGVVTETLDEYGCVMVLWDDTGSGSSHGYVDVTYLTKEVPR
jgi:hypothetical protein